ncbi:4Fe-4S binding protein [Anaerobacillus sp. HL2]|nr:4Fe-4S binding protein [Anaerobacillus sp. HL2]
MVLQKYRDEDSCISCHACTRACPNKIEVSSKRILTPECGIQCVEACPLKDTLKMTVAKRKLIKIYCH